MPALPFEREQAGVAELGEVAARGLRRDAGDEGDSEAVSARPSTRQASMLARAGSPTSEATWAIFGPVSMPPLTTALPRDEAGTLRSWPKRTPGTGAARGV